MMSGDAYSANIIRNSTLKEKHQESLAERKEISGAKPILSGKADAFNSDNNNIEIKIKQKASRHTHRISV